jgi:hypothetical protein
VWKKDSNIVPSLFSLIFFLFFFFFLFIFLFFSLFLFLFVGFFGLFYLIWASLASFIYFLTWDNALTMMIITLLFTHNSRIQQDMTLYECITMMVHVIVNEAMELHGNISQNGYGNAIIDRYGGCFEERNKVGLMHR